MLDDTELLRRYAENHDEPAFAALVRRHVNLVYAAALRRVGGDAHTAEEVTQTVFTALGRKAGALVGHPVLIGWLHRSTHFAAIDALRLKRRKEKREQELPMNDRIVESLREEIAWEEIRPVIDALLDELNERDRGVLLLRFFDGRTFAQIGAKLAVSEDAARMRVERALEKFRGLLARRGVTSTGAALGVVLASQPAVAAPAGFAATVTTAALAGSAAAGGGGALAGLGLFFTMSKIKIGVAAAVVVALAPAVVEVRANRVLKAELAGLRGTGGDDRAALQREAARLQAELGRAAGKSADLDELSRLRARIALLNARPPGVVEGEMKRAAVWRNRGRATPEAASETFHWALFHGDVPTVLEFIVFEDDTPENRAAFLGKFSAAVRARYPTPEQIAAAAFFSATPGAGPRYDPNDRFQLLDLRPDDRPGLMRTRVWYQLASGRESEGVTRWQKTAGGWVIAAHSLVKTADYAVGRFDAATGQLHPRPPLAPKK